MCLCVIADTYIYIYIYIYIEEALVVYWSASKEIIVVDRGQILLEANCISNNACTLEKGMNPYILHVAMGK